ncbi:dynein axonemal-associated protein 1 isoform X3 [Melanotaenia boesemani]|uniref:dynein axonemal-associated protein 1 isoform X3 n=1 Tax=Melanotaenia boesemani TaxID=1250792 RepID=UPI001C057395|nr:dynein axonemal-associated protein 1 isoform X3 [Melanotaenia boesemani]
MDWTQSCWNSVLNEVEHNKPTIDVDFSPPEKEDLIAIFQRPAGFSLSEIPEDLRFLEDPDLEEQLKPTSVTKWSDDIYRQLGDNEIVEDNTSQWCKQCSDAELEASDCESKTMLLTNEADLEASLKLNVNNTNPPILSFARLDQWDLDEVLKNMKDDRLRMQKFKSAEKMSTHADADNNQLEVNILEKLAVFCMNQSVSEHIQNSHCTSQNCVWNKSVAKMQTELQPNHQELPAVYIDLRCPDQAIKAVRITPNILLESKLPVKHTAEKETPPVKEHNLKEHSTCKMDGRVMTGKSNLLQKMREMSRNVNKYPDKCADHLEAEEMKDKAPHYVECICSHDSHHQWADKQSSSLQSRKSKMESPPNAQDASIKEPKQQSNQQKEHIRPKSHHKQDQEVLKLLENHHTAKSVDLKQPAAERTDVLYEFEVSYQESISTLPGNIENEGCVLLTVSLFSPGMVGEKDVAHGKENYIYSAATKSYIYNTLVAWFLSLAGPDSCHTEGGFGAEIPFRVSGLQQLWTKNGLALHVLAVDRQCCTPKERNAGIHAPFYNNVCRFLSNTTLTAVASWLPQLKNLLDQQPFASHIHLPTSCLNSFISANPNKKVIDRIFSLSPRFYWLTVETQEPVFNGKETTQELHTGVSVAVGYTEFFQQPLITHYTLHLILDLGLDVCGLRLLYPPHGLLSESGLSVNQKPYEPCQPILALAVRGPHAHSLLKNLTGSLHHLLHKKTEKSSDNLLDPRSQVSSLIHCPQMTSQVHRELCLWFSGRFQRRNPQNQNQHLNRRSFFDLSRSSSLLCATTKADLFLVVSPAVPPSCYGQVMATCLNRGFSLMGLQRLQLQTNVAIVLGLTGQQVKVFCSSPTSIPDQVELKLPSHCLVLLLRKENMLRHSVTLPSALMREFKDQRLLGFFHFWTDGDHTVEPSLCFHTVPYNDSLFHIFVRCMWTVPKPSNVTLSHQKCSPQSGVNQVVTLALCGKDMCQNLNLLHRVLAEGLKGHEQRAKFELLGLKWLPLLTQLQAQELSPFEVGERFFYGSVDKLMSSSALVCVLRGKDAFSSMRNLLQLNGHNNLTVLMSPTPEVALRQVSLFFFEHELIPYRQMLLTVCLFKPRVWNLALAKIFCKLQQSGLTVVGLHVATLDKSDVTERLPAEGVQYLCPGSLALCLQGENAVKRLLDMLGQEDSSLWLSCYGSRSYQQAIKDVKTLFPEGLCCTETSTMRQEQISSLCSGPVASMEQKTSCILNVAQEGLSALAPSRPIGGSFACRASWQTTCLLIPLKAAPHSKVSSQLEIVDMLLKSGCHLVAGQMSILDDEQQKHIADTLVSSSGSEKMAHFYTAPCLIVALQGEKIVADLKLILESILKERSDLKQEGRNIVYPKCEKEAKHLISYLFGAMSPDCCDATES